MDPDIDPADSLPSRPALARELLLYKMKEYSQDGFCATWLVDLEFELWEAADKTLPATGESYAMAVSKECRPLAQIAGGWWAWPLNLTPNDPAPVFVSLAEWHAILAERAATKIKSPSSAASDHGPRY